MTVSRHLPAPPREFRPLGGALQHAVPYAADWAGQGEKAVACSLAALRKAVRREPAGGLALALGFGLLLALIPRRAR